MRLFDSAVGDANGGEGLSHQLIEADRQLLSMLKDLRVKIREVQRNGKSPSNDDDVNEALDLFFIALVEREHLAVILDTVDNIFQ